MVGNIDRLVLRLSWVRGKRPVSLVMMVMVVVAFLTMMLLVVVPVLLLVLGVGGSDVAGGGTGGGSGGGGGVGAGGGGGSELSLGNSSPSQGEAEVCRDRRGVTRRDRTQTRDTGEGSSPPSIHLSNFISAKKQHLARSCTVLIENEKPEFSDLGGDFHPNTP